MRREEGGRMRWSEVRKEGLTPDPQTISNLLERNYQIETLKNPKNKK